MAWQSLLNWLRRKSGRSTRTAPKRRTSCLLTVEALEVRDVPSYLVTDLGVTAGFDGSYANAINQAGDVAGYEWSSGGVEHAFLWRNGVLTDLGTLGGANSIAFGINDADQVVGQSETGAVDANGYAITHAFLWQNGVLTDLGTLGGPYSGAHGINNLGQVVGTGTTGTVDDYGNTIYGSFLWQNGVMTDLGVSSSSAAAINDAGQVAGTSYYFTDPAYSYLPNTLAYRWQAGATTTLPTNPTLNWGDQLPPTVANGINASGSVVGQAAVDVYDGSALSYDGENWYYGYYQVNRAALWQPDGTLTNLDLGNFYDSYATGINSAGQVVGRAEGADGSRAVTWQNGAIIDLATEVPAGWTPDYAAAIDDAGQIAADANGHAVLLTPVPPPPTLTINNASVIEGNSGTANAVFTVTLSAVSTVPVTVTYATADGTATAGSDYQAASGTLTFAPGETTKTIIVPVNGDRLGESNETFFVNPSGATNATLANGQGAGTILDDEPRISISDVARKEGKKGQKTLFTFTVTLSAAYDQPVTMSFQTVDGTATVRDNDYVAQAGTLTFNPGETTKTITIVVNGDSKKEADETFFVDLFGNSSNSLFTKKRGTGTILNDD
jgi:probable HAF family extracellular repeat protein